MPSPSFHLRRKWWRSVTVISGIQAAPTLDSREFRSFQRKWHQGLSPTCLVFCAVSTYNNHSSGFQTSKQGTGRGGGSCGSKCTQTTVSFWSLVHVFHENPGLQKAICKAASVFAWLVISYERLCLSLLRGTEKWLTSGCARRRIDSTFDHLRRFLSY